MNNSDFKKRLKKYFFFSLVFFAGFLVAFLALNRKLLLSPGDVQKDASVFLMGMLIFGLIATLASLLFIVYFISHIGERNKLSYNAGLKFFSIAI